MNISQVQLASFDLDMMQGKRLPVPACFKKHIALLLNDGKVIRAVVQAKGFRDYAVYRLIFRLLGQLYRYYRQPVIIYCLSYQWPAAQKKVYLTFRYNGKDS